MGVFVKGTNQAFHSLISCTVKYQLHSYMHPSKIQTSKKQSNTEIKSFAVSIRGGPSFHYFSMQKNAVAHFEYSFCKKIQLFCFSSSLYPLKGEFTQI